MTGRTQRAVLAGELFWGMPDLIRRLPGVAWTRVGYTGGNVPNATYRNNGTHAEAIEITLDHDQTDFRTLLEFSSRSTIQRRRTARVTTSVSATARRYITWRKSRGKIEPVGLFWEAEPEHRNYLERYPNGYTRRFVRPGWRLPTRARD